MRLRLPAPSTMRWLILAALLLFWELMPRTKVIPELFLPSLSKTLVVLYSDRFEYIAALGVTLYEVAIAMVFACGVGILVGALVGGVALLRNLLLPVFSSLYAVPIVILYPIFTAWLGGALTIIGVVVAEMLTAAAGIGYLVTRYRTILDSPRVFAAILMILVLSVMFDVLARALERRTLAWQAAGRRPKRAR